MAWTDEKTLGYDEEGNQYLISYDEMSVPGDISSGSYTMAAKIYKKSVTGYTETGYPTYGDSEEVWHKANDYSSDSWFDSTAKSWLQDNYTGGKALSSHVTTSMLGGQEGSTIGELDDFGMEEYSYEKYAGLTPDQAANDIFETRYGGEIPESSKDKYPTPELFKAEIKKRLETAGPRRGEIDKKATSFLAEKYGGETTDFSMLEQYDFNKDGKIDSIDVQSAPQDMKQSVNDAILSGGATKTISFADSLAGRAAGQKLETDMYGIRSEASKISPSISGVSGMGGGMRAGISAQGDIKQSFETSQDTYALAKDTSELAFEEGIYGLEKAKTKEWETNYKTFLGTLPTAG